MAGRKKKVTKKAVKKTVEKTTKKTAKKKVGRPKKSSNPSTESKSKQSSKRSTQKAAKKSVSSSPAKKKTASRKPRKKQARNELAKVLDEVKSPTRRGKKKVQKPKKLDGSNKNIEWVDIDDEGNETEVSMEEGVVLSSQSGKVLGYCPKCDGIISTYDLVSKFIFVCGGCDKRARTNKLKAESKALKGNEYSSKREYMEPTIGSTHTDLPTHFSNAPNLKDN
jgi:hypothetical protein